MYNISSIYSSLYAEAKKLDSYKLIAAYIFLACTILSTLTNNYLSYIFFSLSIISQVFIRYQKFQIKKKLDDAHYAQKISMLYNAFKSRNFKFEMSHIEGSINPWIEKWISQNESKSSSEYINSSSDNSEKNLILMIQENSFFNTHLYLSAFKKSIFKLLLFSIPILIFFFVLIPSLLNFQYDLLLIFKLLLVGLSAIQLWDEIEKAFIWKISATKMLEIDNQINAFNEFSTDTLLFIFAKYNMIKISTPPIPQKTYTKMKDQLNEGWKTRESSNSNNED